MELGREIKISIVNVGSSSNGGAAENNKNSNTLVNHENSLSRRQMESLVALSNTFLPSIEVSDESLVNFYSTSASMAATHLRVGVMKSERVKHPKTWLVKVALWGLSTWYGTFILCGIASLTTTFPYFHSFPNLSLQTRQHIVCSWSHTYFFLPRLLYRAVKLLIHLVFFTEVFIYLFFHL